MDGKTLLHCLAGKVAMQDIIRSLIEEHNANFEIWSFLCLFTTNFNSDNNGNTPYHIAVIHRKLANLNVFINAGANINKQGNKGKTGNHIAIVLVYFCQSCILLLNVK